MVLDPPRDELFSRRRAAAPTLDGVPLAASTARRPRDGAVATGFGYDAAVRARAGASVAALLPQVRDIRRFGQRRARSRLDGRRALDAYYEHGVQPWDVAAGRLICERAGLEVRPLERARRPAGGRPRRAGRDRAASSQAIVG